MIRNPNLVESVAAELERRVLAHVHAPGSRLPSEAALCSEFGVSRSTLREAVGTLQARGLLRREQGRGTFVQREPGLSITTLLEANLSISEMIASMGFEPGTSAVSVTLEVPPPEAASALQLPPGEEVIAVRRLRTANGRPVVYSVDFLPQWSGLPASPESYYGSLYQLLHRHFGAPVAAALAMIRPESAAASLAERLRIRAGDLLLVLHQRHELGDGRTILFSIDYVRNDVFTIYVRRSPGVGSLPSGRVTPDGKSRPDRQEESDV